MAPMRATCPAQGCEFQTEEAELPIVTAALQIRGMSHAITANQNVNVKKPERPEARQDLTETEWNEFLFNWGNYKRNAKIEGKDRMITSELQESCTKAVKIRLFQMKGETLNTISEAELLASIKSTCINKITVTVHRSQFYSMT